MFLFALPALPADWRLYRLAGVRKWYSPDERSAFTIAPFDGEYSYTWTYNNVPHRIGGPAVIAPSSSQQWFHYGSRHRVDGPAVEWANGKQEWFRDNQLHREDGPAVIRPNGATEWWLNGQFMGTRGFEYLPQPVTSEPAKILHLFR